MVMDQAMHRTDERPAGPLAVSTAGLTKHFGDRVVVDDLALAIPSGSVCGFVGPNGAGFRWARSTRSWSGLACWPGRATGTGRTRWG
jgi:ABC-type protease/lipase transport system fused ATPase/permease subunit